jgi:hypothetical protein
MIENLVVNNKMEAIKMNYVIRKTHQMLRINQIMTLKPLFFAALPMRKVHVCDYNDYQDNYSFIYHQIIFPLG